MKTFRHGVHPPESKDETSGLPVRQFPFAPLLIIPLVQHMGAPSIPVVAEGEEVSRGQRIARADGFVSVAMHAPASGVIRRHALGSFSLHHIQVAFKRFNLLTWRLIANSRHAGLDKPAPASS
jgi:Na+-translocating ferredoxin:NAD+ oxidoreductase RnfC subunit